jgi:hypothetical protein
MDNCQNLTERIGAIALDSKVVNLSLVRYEPEQGIVKQKEIQEALEYFFTVLEDGRRIFGPEAEAVNRIIESLLQKRWNKDQVYQQVGIKNGHVYDIGYGSGNSTFYSFADFNKLAYLESLSIEGFSAEDGMPLDLSRMKRLKNLSVQSCTDIVLIGLEKASSLRSLGICQTYMKHLPNLTRLQDLEYFDARFTELDSLECIRNHPTLNNIRISGCQLQDVSALGTVANLKELLIFCMPVKSLDFVHDLKNLVSLEFNLDLVSSLDFITGMTTIKDLGIRGSKITNWSPLSTLSGLETFSISDNLFSDTESLSQLIRLEEISFDDTGVVDLTPLLKLPKLKSLNLYKFRYETRNVDIIKQLEQKGVRVYLEE